MSRVNIIENLINEGVLSLYHDYRLGNMQDLSGNGNHGSGTGTFFTSKGVSFPLSTSVITVPDDATIDITEGTLIVLGEFTSQVSFEYLISRRDSSGTQYQFHLSSLSLNYWDGTNASLLNENVRGDKYLAVNFKAGEYPEFFVQGVYVGVGDDIIVVNLRTSDIYIGNRYDDNRVLNSILSCALILNRKLTETEHSLLYSELANL